MFRWLKIRRFELCKHLHSEARSLRSAVSAAWHHPLRLLGTVIVLAAIATFVNWIVSTAGAGFDEQIVGEGDTRRRTLWDWLDLLLIPFVLGASAFLFNIALQRRQTQLAREENEKDRELARVENETERDVARNRSQEETLRHYMDTMQRLMLDRGDDSLKHGADARLRNVARARTLAVIRALSGSASRIDQVIRFLVESYLLDVVDADANQVPEAAVTLQDADFDSIDLSHVGLPTVNLRGADLHNAHMEDAILTQANLTLANLIGADLSDAFLENVHFEGALLIGARFDRADMKGAILTDANLRYAKLRSARNVTRDQLNSAIVDETTELPDIIGDDT